MKQIKPHNLIPGKLYYCMGQPQCILRYINTDGRHIRFAYSKGDMIYARNTDGSIGFWHYDNIFFFNYNSFKYGK